MKEETIKPSEEIMRLAEKVHTVEKSIEAHEKIVTDLKKENEERLSRLREFLVEAGLLEFTTASGVRAELKAITTVKVVDSRALFQYCIANNLTSIGHLKIPPHLSNDFVAAAKEKSLDLSAVEISIHYQTLRKFVVDNVDPLNAATAIPGVDSQTFNQVKVR